MHVNFSHLKISKNIECMLEQSKYGTYSGLSELVLCTTYLTEVAS